MIINNKINLCEYIKKNKNKIIVIMFINNSCTKSIQLKTLINKYKINYGYITDISNLQQYIDIWNINTIPSLMILKVENNNVIPLDKLCGFNSKFFINKFKKYNLIV